MNQVLLDNAFAQLRQTIITNMEQAGHVATGRTRDAIQYSVNQDGGTLEAPAWLATLETGRGPVRGGDSKGAFLENLKTWIVAKQIPFNGQEDLERLARFFRWYINKFGTRQWRSGTHTDIITTPLEQFAETLSQQHTDSCMQELAQAIDY